MAGSLYDAHDGLRGRPAVSLGQPQRTTRSWTSNGVQYTVDSTSWAGPGLSFAAMSSSANGPIRTFTAPSRTRQPNHLGFGSALLGTAFGLLDDLTRHTMHPQHTVIGGDNFGGGASSRRVHISTDSDEEDDHLAYGNGLDSTRRKKSNRRSIFGRLKDRIVDGNHPRRQDSSTSRSQSPAQSPAQQPNIPQRPEMPSRRHSSYKTETREPEYVQRPIPDFIEVDYHDDQEPEPVPEPEMRRSRSRRQSVTEAEMIESLENAVEMERRNVRACKMALTQASRQSNASSTYLQRILDELRGHETTLANAIGSLNDARAAQHRNSRPPARSRSQPRPRVQEQRQQRSAAAPRSFDEELLDPFGGFAPLFPSHMHRPDVMFRAFDDLHGAHFGRTNIGAFEQLFEQSRVAPDDAHYRFFSMPGGPQPNARSKRQRHSTPNGGFGTAQPNGPPPAYTTFQPAPPPQPPATMLRPDEAKRLFKTYNDRWNSLPNTSSDVPFPARGLHAGGLAARESIWAPAVSEHVSNWSDETVMQANAQAFFLGVVGLMPRYTKNPGSGRIECGFDKSSANAVQVKELTDILKKEKTRWHSDRLGRRNDGRGGVNERLQKDERARAVFHAVCELMTVVDG